MQERKMLTNVQTSMQPYKEILKDRNMNCLQNSDKLTDALRDRHTA